MFRPLTSALTLATLAAAPVAARDNAPFYHAELAKVPAKSQVIAGGVLWMCEGTECFAGKGTGRPVVMCRRLAEASSPVVRFSYAGADLSADDLKQCNG
jgi:hypothetical protein